MNNEEQVGEGYLNQSNRCQRFQYLNEECIPLPNLAAVEELIGGTDDSEEDVKIGCEIIFGTSGETEYEKILEAADDWIFYKNGMKWSNNDNTAGDNFGSFIAGAKWMQERLKQLKDEDIRNIE